MGGWLITGAGGQLGSVLMRRLVARGSEVTGVVSLHGPRPAVGACVPLDLRDHASVVKTLRVLQPRFVVHAAAMTNLAQAFVEPEEARLTNVDATRCLVELAEHGRWRFAFISSDMVFGGDRAPYSEDDQTAPVGVYGRTKVEAEQFVSNGRDTVVLRVPLMYGVPAVARETTFLQQVRALRQGAPLTLFEDEFRTPLWLEDAAQSVIAATESDITGILHLGGPERLSRLKMGLLLARALNMPDTSIVARSRLEASSPEPRPYDLCLRSARFLAAFQSAPGRPMADALAVLFASGTTC